MTWNSHSKMPLSAYLLTGKFSHIKIFHWFVLLLSLSLTLIVWNSIRQQNQKLVTSHFDQEVNGVIELVSERMHKYELALWAGTAIIKAHKNDVSLQDWIDFSEVLEIDRKYPGINGIGVIHSVQSDKVQAYIASHRKLRPNFKIYPEHDEQEYLPITYIEPVEDNVEAVGLDMAHEKNRYTAALKARDTGVAQITGPITLVQDSGKTPGFLFFVPYYTQGKHVTEEARESQFLGLVYAPFIVNRLMQGVIGESHRTVQVRISDMDEVIYNEYSKSETKTPIYQKIVDLEFYGRNWSFDIRSYKVNNQVIGRDYSTFVLFVGAIIIGLLYFLFQAQTKITKRANLLAKKMTAELEEKTKKLKRSNEDLEQFAYVASHDLQEPLRVIGNFTQLLQRRYQGKIDDKADLYIKHTVDGVTQMQQLLIDLLNYARVTSSDSEFKSTDLNLIAQGVLRDLDLIISESNATIEVDKLPSIVGESSQLHQLLQNLVANAIKFRVLDRDLVIKVKVSDRGKEWCFSVSDNGIGMEEQYMGKIFIMFQRLHNRTDYKGSGVGLAICKKVVLSHGGEIWVESKFGSGSTFFFTLPK